MSTNPRSCSTYAPTTQATHNCAVGRSLNNSICKTLDSITELDSDSILAHVITRRASDYQPIIENQLGLLELMYQNTHHLELLSCNISKIGEHHVDERK